MGRRPAIAALPTGGAAILFLFALVPIAFAHEGGVAIVVEPDRISPGGTVVIRGDSLGTDAIVRLRLAGPHGNLDIATAMSDAEGHLTAALAIPAELPAGSYSIEVVDGLGGVVAGRLVVEGTPIVDEQAGVLDREEPLVVALPPGWTTALSGSPAASQPATSREEFTGRSVIDYAPLAIPPIVAAVLLLRLRRRPRPVA